MNLAILSPSRRTPKAGDIFVARPPDGRYLFGRVVTSEAIIGPIKRCVLVYIHAARAQEKRPVPILRASELLVPPLLTNLLPWSRGFFEFVENRPIVLGERLRKHSFVDSSGRYFDEFGHRLPGPTGPVGNWGLHSYQTIDDAISDALGLPRSCGPE